MTTIVAIDGPAGSGKSTVGRGVAERLGIPYVDTGAMYRAVGLRAVRAGHSLPIRNPEAIATLAEGCAIDLIGEPSHPRVLLDGEDVSEEIRKPEIAMWASAVSAIPAVRRVLVELQRAVGRRRGGVLEGRDIGTVVFPETPHRFFLTANPRTRAERRHEQEIAKGRNSVLEVVLHEQEERDRSDMSRADSPLLCDERYVLIDSSSTTAEAVVDRIVAAVEGAGSVAKGASLEIGS